MSLADQRGAAGAASGCSRSRPSKCSRSARDARRARRSGPSPPASRRSCPSPIRRRCRRPRRRRSSGRAVDRAEQRRVRRGELDGQDCGSRAEAWLISRFSFGIERIAQAVADQVERQHGDQDREARKRHDPRRALDELAARRPASSPIPASAAARRGRESRAPPPRGSRWRSRASPARSAAPGSSAGRCRTSAAACRRRRCARGHVVARELADRRGARQPHVVRQQSRRRSRSSR